MADKTSAVASEEPVVDVLFALHDKFDMMDFAGPLEVLNMSLHDTNNRGMSLPTQPLLAISPAFYALFTDLPFPIWVASKAFDITIAAAEPKVLSDAGVIIGSQISFKEAHERLEDFDVVVVLGGNTDATLKAKAEPLDLITAYSEVQKKDPTRE